MAKTPDTKAARAKAQGTRVHEVQGRDIPEDAIQLVSADVAFGTRHNTVVHRSPQNPITYPEALLLNALHEQPGQAEAVRRVKHVGWVMRTIRAEKARLLQTYGGIAETMFPGRDPQMERFNPIDAPAPGVRDKVGDFAAEADGRARDLADDDGVVPAPERQGLDTLHDAGDDDAADDDAGTGDAPAPADDDTIDVT